MVKFYELAESIAQKIQNIERLTKSYSPTFVTKPEYEKDMQKIFINECLKFVKINENFI